MGKSSLINTIFRRKGIARVSQTPGKTQAVQFYLVNNEIYVVDLPGYGYAKVPKGIRSEWGALIESYFETSEQLRIFFLLLDFRREPTDDDMRMHQWGRALGVDEKLVLTKADKLSNNQRANSKRIILNAMGDVAPDDVIAFSSETREGVDAVWRAIDRAKTPDRRTV